MEAEGKKTTIGAVALLSSLLSSCAASSSVAPGPEPEPIPTARLDPGPAPPAAASSAPAEPKTAEKPCPPPPDGALVWLSCDGARIDTSAAVELHPAEAVPREPTKRVLDGIAALLGRNPELLLIRIEVFASAPGRNPEERRSEIARAQSRADAIFQYLWRRRHISPERLEAVGYPYDAKKKRHGERWPVVFVVAQHARSPTSD